MMISCDGRKNRICLSASVYNLFLYLLYSSEEEINNTFFFLCSCIPEQIRNRISYCETLPLYLSSRKEKLSFLFKLRIFKHFNYPISCSASIYAQDHLPIAPYVIGNRKYFFVEDGPNIFSITKPTEMWRYQEQYKKSRSIIQSIKDSCVSRSIAGIMGNNPLCKEVIVTTDDTAPYLSEKTVSKVDIFQLWAESSINKQKYILDIFDVDNDTVNQLSGKSIILFTQPFSDDGELSVAEQKEIYQYALSKYDHKDVIIKTHPRDSFDYTRFFPDVPVFNKPVPFQLLGLLGLRFEVAITVCSTAVTLIPYDIKIDWIGASINPKILKSFGDVIPESVRRKII